MKGDKVNFINKIVGEKIKAKRIKCGYNQGELASGVSLTRTSIVNIEKGRQSVTIEGLMKLAAVLKCRPQDLLPLPLTADIKELKKVVREPIEQKLLDVNFKW